MDQLDEQISRDIKRIAGTDDKSRYPVMSGVVKSVDDVEMTATVLFTNDDESAPTEGVLLNVKTNNTTGAYGIPAAGSDCIVAEIDGDGKWQVIWASKYVQWVVIVGSSKVTVKDGLIQFNDGSLEGLPILSKIVANQKAIRDYIKEVLEPAIKATIIGVGAGTSADGPGAVTTDWIPAITGQDMNFENMENTNIKQG